MPVKELVGLFESRSTPPSTPPALAAPRRKSTRRSTTPQSNPGSPSTPVTPTPSPARFVQHPLLAARIPRTDDVHTTNQIDGLPEAEPSDPLEQLADSPPSESTTLLNGSTGITDGTSSVEIDDNKSSSLRAETLASSTVEASSSQLRARGEEHEMESLLPHARYASGTSYSPPNSLRKAKSPYFPVESDSASLASTSTVVQTATTPVANALPPGPHKPIPAATLFARNAAPLYLPRLDDYISTIPAPSFPKYSTSSTPTKGKNKNPGAGMFPPMDKLQNSMKSIVDLEDNATLPPFWKDRSTIFGSLVTGAIGITGSSALASFYSLHGLFDTIQIFALILNTIVPHAGKDLSDQWRKLFLGTIPNILALNLATTTVISLVLLIVFMVIVGVLLFFFYRATSLCCKLGAPEGLQQPAYMTNSWSLVIISFILTILYLPLSTMAMHVLVWSEDLWVVPNPYTNATSFPPVVPPLGPPDEFRDPLDFCYTTTMKRNQINFAPIVFIFALVCIAGLTVWFPLHLRKAINIVSPKVDKYTELGVPRSQSDLDREYQRVLARDTNPLAFLYYDFRRGWADYEAITLFFKLTALALTAIIDPDNCIFRSANRTVVPIVCQILLLIAMLGFFILHCFLAPFLDPVANAGEWISRLNYVLTALVSLLVAVNIPGKSIVSGPILYVIYGVTYGLSIYFILIDFSFMRRLVKRLARRIDFSIDIFSPRIDLSPTSVHAKRRIWQESITTLFLTSSQCAIPKTQKMIFAQARDAEYPPYLLDFTGSPAERHVENLKVLREVGNQAYGQGVSLIHGPDFSWFQYVQQTIQSQFIGPDCYWKDPKAASIPGCTSFFGNAWWIPFPPTVVIRQDDGPIVVVRDVADLQLYIDQNQSPHIQRRREIRLALRALDGKVVRWPYEHVEFIGSRWPLWSGRRYRAQKTQLFQTALFRLKRRGRLIFEGTDLGSGFDVELTYSKRVVVGGSVIGLNDDFDLTTPLARFLSLNEALIPSSLTQYEDVLGQYRSKCSKECAAKVEALTYKFLTAVYDNPREPDGLTQSSIEVERDPRVKQLMLSSEAVFEATFYRLSVVTKSEISAWWYIFWDDLWRRNYDTISAMQKYASDFNPHYPTSIAYTPLPRPALENFLTQRGLLNKKPKWGDFFHGGFLNKLYVRMNDILFHGSADADIIHLGEGASEFDMEEIDQQTQARPSTLGTGGGTDYDDASIRARPLYRWEGILSDKLSKSERHHPNLLAKFGVWFGVSPLWRSGVPSKGLAFDVLLQNGRYVLLRGQQQLQSMREYKAGSTIGKTISKIA